MNDDRNPDRATRLRSPDEAARFVNSESQDNDVDTLLDALQQVAREHGISRIADISGLSRESLYRSLSKGGNPGVRSLHRIVGALGLRLQVLPANVPPMFTNEEYKIMSQPGFSGGTPDTSAFLPIFEKEFGALMHRTKEEIAGLVRSAEAKIATTIAEARVELAAPRKPTVEVESMADRSTAIPSLAALTDPDEIAAIFSVMTDGLRQNAERFDIFVGWPGGGDNLPVYWQHSAGLWSLAEAFGGNHPGYWYGFGIQNPAGRTQMAPDVQLGMIGSGSNRRFAGVFARDTEGRVYATHNGRFQVRHQRTSPEAFLLAHPHQNVATVRWPDGIERTHLRVAAVDDPQLVTAVSSFVQTVKAYKEHLRGS